MSENNISIPLKKSEKSRLIRIKTRFSPIAVFFLSDISLPRGQICTSVEGTASVTRDPRNEVGSLSPEVFLYRKLVIRNLRTKYDNDMKLGLKT